MLGLECFAEFSKLWEGVVKHVHSCDCGDLAESFAKSECLWLTCSLMDVVESQYDCTITCLHCFYTLLMCQPACSRWFSNFQLW